MQARFLLVGGLVWMSTLSGCGEGSGRQAAEGIVTLDGNPLPNGVISFRPAEGNQAPGSGGVVIDGRFEVTVEKGLQPGKYTVDILVLKETGRMIQVVPGGPEKPERVPVEVNESKQLEAMVTSDDKNRFEFHLTTAN